MVTVPQTKPQGEEIATLMGRAGDTEAVSLANAYIDVVWSMAHEYTRGRGFNDDGTEAAPSICSAVKLAVIRLTVNPTQTKRYAIGEYQETPTVFEGFTLAELAVLNCYRVRAL
ncbi:hypothetical protein [Brevibacterium linens]|uniref:Phage gp6-like head-tail connector protein n=1 Tax=Brevibacterium linens ATCC 9172 TaxID=1255617 RepID=A0A2H1J417_BRELN|nr:hypothetical protein [Brevibacterium linens]KAB1942291.1 hypothetical protein F8227_17255 [Brevibacterium linens ATCC 9172]SMX82163.1 hypothetical protein BLIN9172_01738 [Brevibacterium linens ATCC 9172]